MTRRRFVCGTWKMHKTSAEAVQVVRELREKVKTGAQVAVAPPYTALAAVEKGLEGVALLLFAYKHHQEEQGGFTGGVSGALRGRVGRDGGILGDSERRQ